VDKAHNETNVSFMVYVDKEHNETFNVLLTVHHAMILGNCPT